MSFQTIFDRAQRILVNRGRVGGHTITRSGQIRTGSLASRLPWSFTVTPPAMLPYSDARSVIEDIASAQFSYNSGISASVASHTISLGGSNPRLGYITRYQGDIPQSDVSDMYFMGSLAGPLTIRVWTGNISPAPTVGTILFRTGDIISLNGGYRYPYVVTDTVTHTGGTVDIPIHRPYISQNAYTAGVNSRVITGGDVTWRLAITRKPGYRLIPGELVEFDGDFEFTEIIED